MPGDNFDLLSISKHLAEGRSSEFLTRRSKYDTSSESSPAFLRFVVLEVISDPTTLDKVKLAHFENDLNVGNISYAAVAPRNSIIARQVMGNGVTASDKVMVLYPFFPPHVSFPAKPGEHVWGMFEHPDAKINDVGYWFCRIVFPNYVEDVNHSHADRQYDAAFLPGLTDVFEGTDDPPYEFRNGAVDEKDGNRYTVPNTVSLSADKLETAYSDLLENSDASKVIDYEPVPRYRKRPADIALEGSNNTLIVLGNDRTSIISDYDDDPNLGKVPKPNVDDVVGGTSGAIDIVAGRGQTDATMGQAVTNQPLSRKELGKHKKVLAATEGDVDLKNDRSRILVSQKTKPDKNFKIDTLVQAHAVQPSIADGAGEGAIVIKTDKIRFIARHDVIISVIGADPADAQGNVKDPDIDVSKCSSIILRTNGDIIITPSQTGTIKLGGDDANLAVLCVVAPNAAAPGGAVVGAPITNNFGGVNGAGGQSGQWGTKVLIK